jgi:hypothetical protein
MKFKIRWGLLLIPAFALAMPAFAPMPAFAQTRDTRLSDSQQPGSVIVFPKFIGGRSAAGGPVVVDGVPLPRTEIELGVVCPPGVARSLTQCFQHQTIKVHGDWVCPGSQDPFFKYVCQDTSFDVYLSLDGKLAFSADGARVPYWTNQVFVPAPQCKNGYLIMWVVDNAGRAIKFDGLIGDAVLRGPNNAVATTSVLAGSSTAVSAYQGITFQADPALPIGTAAAPTLISTAGNELHFSGAPGEYLGTAGVLYGDVKFDNEAPAHAGTPTPANAFSETFLIFLTLDTNSNHSNNPTFVPITFHNESLNTVSTSNPLWEAPTDTSVEFICWGQFQLSAIDDNLTQLNQGSRKGIFVAGPAEKMTFLGSPDETGAATLLGLVHTVEGTLANRYQERSYIFTPYNDSVFVETEFEFLPSFD